MGRLLSLAAAAAILAAGWIYAATRWRQGRLGAEDACLLAVLALAAFGYPFLQFGGVSRLEQWEREQHNARQRRFWREREARERRQREEQDEIDAERAEIRAQRRSRAGG